MPANTVLDADSRDAAIELLTLGIGQASEMLSDLIGARIELSVDAARLSSVQTRMAGLFSEDQSPETIITQAFEGQLQGRAMLCFSATSGITLAKLLSGRSGTDQSELDAELSEILLEVGNIVLNGVTASLANATAAELRHSLPELQSANRKGEQLLVNVAGNDEILICNVTFGVSQQDIDGTVIAVCPGIRRMLGGLLEANAALETA